MCGQGWNWCSLWSDGSGSFQTGELDGSFWFDLTQDWPFLTIRAVQLRGSGFCEGGAVLYCPALCVHRCCKCYKSFLEGEGLESQSQVLWLSLDLSQLACTVLHCWAWVSLLGPAHCWAAWPQAVRTAFHLLWGCFKGVLIQKILWTCSFDSELTLSSMNTSTGQKQFLLYNTWVYRKLSLSHQTNPKLSAC